MNKKDYIYILLFIIVFYVALRGNDYNITVFDLTMWKELLCIFLSIFSIALTVFFVIMALSAYGKVHEIDTICSEAKEKAEMCSKIHLNVQQQQDSVNSIAQQSKSISTNINSIYEQTQFLGKELVTTICFFYDNLTLSAEISKDIKLRDEYKKLQARLLCNNHQLNDDVRRKFILELSSIGDYVDIEYLEKISTSDTESETIKYLAKFVVEELKRKYSKDSEQI
jgi:hypothetical protein